MLLANYAARSSLAKRDWYVFDRGISPIQLTKRCRLMAVAVAI